MINENQMKLKNFEKEQNEIKENEEDFEPIEIEPEELNSDLKNSNENEELLELDNLEINLEDKNEIMKKRANQILEGEIVDYKIGKLKDLKKIRDFEKQYQDKYFIKLIVKTTNAPEVCGTDNWVFPDYSNIHSLVMYKKLSNNSKLFKILKRYLGSGKATLKQLKGLKVKVKTNEKGYASILV
jgi:hypothetical protein